MSFPIFPHLGRHLFGRGVAPSQSSFQVSPAQELGRLLDEGGPLRQINVSIWLHLASLRGQHGCVRCWVSRRPCIIPAGDAKITERHKGVVVAVGRTAFRLRPGHGERKVHPEPQH